jgi:Zinc-binding dehydrogenase
VSPIPCTDKRNVILSELTIRIFTHLFDLISKGYIKPIHPIKTFPFEDLPGAFRYMRGGKDIGKIVISSGEDLGVQVPVGYDRFKEIIRSETYQIIQVRKAQRKLKLRSDVSYLIVGGLKGLCGSLAIYLAQTWCQALSCHVREWAC